MKHVTLCNSVILEKKAIYKWIESMEQPYRKQAEQAMFSCEFADRNTLVGSLKSALLRGFIWGSTEQGINYWENIYQGVYPVNPLF